MNWVANIQDGLARVARQEMTGEQWRVFAYLLSRLDFDNFLKVVLLLELRCYHGEFQSWKKKKRANSKSLSMCWC